MELVIFLIWFVPLMLTIIMGSVVYFPARLEWNDTFKRAALITRSNLGSKSAKKELVQEQMALNPYEGDPGDKKAMALWEAQFEGKELVLADQNIHRIVNSWNELHQTAYDDQPKERWFWECSCGEKESRLVSEAARQAAKRHMKLYNGRNEEGVRNVGWLRM